MQDLSYCGEQIKKYDPDRYLLSLFCPKNRYEAIWSTFAFNLEIAKTREVVSEPQLGFIRLQWWREALQALYAGQDPLKHEVVEPLAQAIAAYDLHYDDFDQLLRAREQDFDRNFLKDIDSILAYANNTSVPLNKIILDILYQEDPLLEGVSRAYALVGLLRSSAYFAQQNIRVLPKDIAVKDIVEHAMVTERPHTKYLRAQNALIGLYIKQIEKCDYDLNHPDLNKPVAFKELRVWLGSF